MNYYITRYMAHGMLVLFCVGEESAAWDMNKIQSQSVMDWQWQRMSQSNQVVSMYMSQKDWKRDQNIHGRGNDFGRTSQPKVTTPNNAEWGLKTQETKNTVVNDLPSHVSKKAAFLIFIILITWWEESNSRNSICTWHIDEKECVWIEGGKKPILGK